MLDCDVAVVGLGVMGAATLAALARRGVRAVGIERFDVPHALGSSHGGTRVIRKAYFEDPSYVPLLHRAWDAWRRLEAEVGETLLVQTGGLHFGPERDAELQAVVTAAETHGLEYEVLSPAAIVRRFPQFRPDVGDVGVVEVDAGVLYAERCVQALVASAMNAGAIVRAREQVEATELGERVVLRTSRGVISCRRVVMTVGPWWPEHAPVREGLDIGVALRVTRQVQLWVRPDALEHYQPGRLPVFLRYGSDLVYGLPEAVLPGLKLALHTKGETASPEGVDRALRPADEAPIRAFIRRFMPGADGPLLGARVCMYTNSSDGHFALGIARNAPQVVVGTGFSGHGFKLAPEVGEILADYAIDGASARTIDLFQVGRA